MVGLGKCRALLRSLCDISHAMFCNTVCTRAGITYSVTAGKSLQAVYHLCGGSGHVGLSEWIIIFAISELFASQVCTAVIFDSENSRMLHYSAWAAAFASQEMQVVFLICIGASVVAAPVPSGRKACGHFYMAQMFASQCQTYNPAFSARTSA